MQNTFMQRAALALLATQRHDWEHGTAMQAFLECGMTDAVVAMAREAVFRQRPDGRAAALGHTKSVTDPCACGEALIYAARVTGDEALLRGRDALLRWALETAPRNKKGILYHVDDAPEFWADSVYMLPPFLAAAGCFPQALQQMDGYWDALYDPQAALMRHIWNDDTQTFRDGAHWGTGSGWALAGLIRTAALLPETMREQAMDLRRRAQTLLDGVLSHMRPDGLFHDVLDDPDSFVETNLSQMTAYCIYRGVTESWLGARYLPFANRMRSAALSHTDRFGFVTPVCGAPSFDKPGASPEAQAFSLMLCTAHQAYMKTQ